MTRNALGRGLGALIRESTPAPVPVQQASAAAPARSAESQTVDIDLIEPSPFQPRTHFREEAIAELAQSIQNVGILQPLVLRPVGGRFQLLAGERRWRAAQRAGLSRVPCLVREVSDEKALEITLVENIQREDLNPVEQARAFERLMSEFHLTQEEVAARTAKDRTTVANAIRLLRLEQLILDLIEEGKLSPGHGRALLAIPDTKLRLTLARQASRGGLTVRQVERLAARHNRGAKETAVPAAMDPNTRAALEQLQHALGLRVTLRAASKTKPGELSIEYYDDAQLANLYERLTR